MAAVTEAETQKRLIQGVQGVVRRALVNGIPCISKSSAEIDFTTELEYAALKKLSSLKNPHFPHLVHYKKDYLRPVVFIRELRGTNVGSDLDAINTNPKVIPEAKVNLIFQTLCACKIMHDYMDMAHNDLHTANVLVEPTRADVVVYKYADGNNYAFKTYGLRPVLIDFGMVSMTSDRWMGTGDITDIGIFTFYPDQFTDVRRLICSSAMELRRTYNYQWTYYDGSAITRFFATARAALSQLPLEHGGWFVEDNTFPNLMLVLSKALVDGHVPILGKGKNINLTLNMDNVNATLQPREVTGVFFPLSSSYYEALALLAVPTPVPAKTTADPMADLYRIGGGHIAAAQEVQKRFLLFISLWRKRDQIPDLARIYSMATTNTATAKVDLGLLKQFVHMAADFKRSHTPTEYGRKLIDKTLFGYLLEAFVELTKAVSKFLDLWFNVLREQMGKCLSTIPYNTIADVLSLAKSDPISFKPGMVVETQDFVKQVITTTTLSTVSEINALNKLTYANFSGPTEAKILKRTAPIPPTVMGERVEEPMFIAPPPETEGAEAKVEIVYL